MQVKKFYIRVLAILMAVTIAVTTPLSDFADIKGMKQTHAVAPALITLGGLFGAIAGAYGLYVAVDKLGDYAENWFNWTADNATDARTDLQKIKDGVTSYVLTKAVTQSVADFLSDRVSDTYAETIKGSQTMIDRLPSDAYSKSFLNYYENTLASTYAFPIAILQNANSSYESGYYQVVYINPNHSKFSEISEMFDNDSVSNVAYHTKNKVGSGSYLCTPLALTFYDESGLPLYFTGYQNPSANDNLFVTDTYYFDSSSWGKKFTGSPLKYEINDSRFDSGFIKTLVPIYRSSLNVGFSESVLYETLVDSTFNKKSVTVDYKTHGNNALDNVDALTGAEVSEETLTHLYDVSSEAYQNYLKSQQDNNDNNNDINYAPLASAMTAAIIASLKDMGYIKNPTDEPSGENVKEQLGNIQISLDGLIDAISQINPAQGLANIAQGLAELPQKITNAVTSAFKNVMEELFTPNTEAMEEILNDFSDRFPWTTVLFDYSRDLGRIFDYSEPPKIYIHFQDSEDNRFHKVGTQVIFDASWYEPYKPTGDAILSVFIYAFFLWKLFKRIPDILSGAGMTTEASIRFEDNTVKAGKG